MMRRSTEGAVLRFADILLGEGDAVGCRHCRSQHTVTLRDASEVLADVRTAARTWADGPGPNLALTGAEPFAHPALASIISACADAGVERLRLDSGCAALSAPEVAREVLHAGVRHLRFALVGSNGDAHDPLLGTAGAFEQTMRGVASFRAAAAEMGVAVHVSARVPVCRHDLGDVPGIVARAAEAGAAGVLAHVTDPRLELPSAAAWVSTACDTGLLNATWVEVEGVPLCLAGEWHLHLASNHRPVAGTKSAACTGCPLDSVCGGATRGATHAVTAALRPPADADRLAARIRHGLYPVVSARG